MKQTIVTGYEYELTLITGEKKILNANIHQSNFILRKVHSVGHIL